VPVWQYCASLAHKSDLCPRVDRSAAADPKAATRAATKEAAKAVKAAARAAAKEARLAAVVAKNAASKDKDARKRQAARAMTNAMKARKAQEDAWIHAVYVALNALEPMPATVCAQCAVCVFGEATQNCHGECGAVYDCHELVYFRAVCYGASNFKAERLINTSDATLHKFIV
jgi:hypothetical protein